jgi:cellulose synthase/poly-beta-1,6-N-acetylglucosamine synthase-like glycosyltransferase
MSREEFAPLQKSGQVLKVSTGSQEKKQVRSWSVLMAFRFCFLASFVTECVVWHFWIFHQNEHLMQLRFGTACIMLVVLLRIFMGPLQLLRLLQLWPETRRERRRRLQQQSGVDNSIDENVSKLDSWLSQRGGRVRVDTLVPCCSEPLDVIMGTVNACVQMHVPNGVLHRVVVCDDGVDSLARDAVDALARSISSSSSSRNVSLHYESRGATHARVNGKAGNLNFALKRLDDMDAAADDDIAERFVLLFDCDMTPLESALRVLLAEMAAGIARGERLAFVQSPHAFKTTFMPSDERSEDWLPRAATLLYRMYMPCKDAVGAAPLMGTNVILRRAALDDVHNFPEWTVTEDSACSLEMHARGWKSRYIERDLAFGLVAPTFAAYCRQMCRYATGNMTMFVYRNPLIIGGLSWKQRLSYLEGTMWPLGAFGMLSHIATALIVTFYGMLPFAVHHSPSVAFFFIAADIFHVLFYSCANAFGQWPERGWIFRESMAAYCISWALVKALCCGATEGVSLLRHDALERSQVHASSSLSSSLVRNDNARRRRRQNYAGPRAHFCVTPKSAPANASNQSFGHSVRAHLQQLRANPALSCSSFLFVFILLGSLVAPVRLWLNGGLLLRMLVECVGIILDTLSKFVAVVPCFLGVAPDTQLILSVFSSRWQNATLFFQIVIFPLSLFIALLLI